MRRHDDCAIAVFCYPSLGDAVVTHSLIRMIRARFPAAPIDLIARAPGVEVAALMPEVRAGIREGGGHGRLALGERLALARRLRGGGYERAYVVSRGWKAALTATLAGIPERVGWFGELRWGLITDMRFADLHLLRSVDRTCSLALDPGEARPCAWPAPRLQVPPARMAEWRRRHTELADGRPILAVAPGASDIRRDWPIERFRAVARHFDARGWRVLAVGSARQTAMCQAVRAACGPLARTHARDGVVDLACAIRGASLFVGNDSGPNHVAAGLGIPAVGVFGPGFEPPLNTNAIVVTSQKPRRAWTPAEWPSVGEVIAALEREAARRDRAAAPQPASLAAG